MADSDPDDKTVKELIDAATRAELEKWFGLPSFQQVDEQKAAEPEEDPDIVAVRERRQKAIEAVDPAMLEAHRRRTEPRDDLLTFKMELELRVNPDVAMLDQWMIDKQATIAEPREVEIPEQLVDDLKDCAPQAILRDLHRPEADFQKTFEVQDIAAEQRLDIVAVVSEYMSMRYAIRPDHISPFTEGRELLRELRAERMRKRDAAELAKLPNRRVEG